MTPEGKVKDEVRKILKRHRAWFFAPVSNGMGVHGIPDYVACIKGRLVTVECKGTDAGRPTELQMVQMERIAEAGGYVFLATPGTLGALDSALTLLEEEWV